MLDSIRHYIGVGTCFMRLAIKRQLEYPSFLVCWAIGIPIQYIAGVWMIGAITTRFQALNGWTFPHITFLYGLSLLSHGLMVVLFIQTWQIERHVINGMFDRLFVRPMGVVFQFCVQYFNFIGLLDMIPGTIIFLYGCKAVGFVWSIANIGKLALVLLGAVLIRAATFCIAGSVAFWTKSSRSMVGPILTLLERTTQYPLSIYPYAIQAIFTFIIPFAFISFFPASAFLGKAATLSFPLGFALLTPVVGIAFATFAILVFRIGLKRYEGAGS